MAQKKVARSNRYYPRADGSTRRTTSIVSNYEQACFVAGLMIAVSFGIMFVIGMVMF